MKREEYRCWGDGWSVYYEFDCVLCSRTNSFVNPEYDEQTCKYCHHATYLNPIPLEDQ